MKKILCIILLLFYSSYLYAAPDITGVTGTIEDEEIVTVGGTDFGGGPSNQIYDSFDAGPATNDIPLTCDRYGEWSYYGTVEPVYFGNGKSGSYSAELYYSDAGHRQIVKTFSAVTEIFVSYWLRIPVGTYFPIATAVETFPSGSNWKNVWVMDNDSTANDDICLPTYISSNNWAVQGNDLDVTMHLGVSWWNWDDWMRVTFWLKADPDNPSTVNGTFHVQIISAGETMYTQTKTDAPVFAGGKTPFQWTHLKLAGWVRSGADSTYTDPLVDDFYFARGENAQARIEIGNSDTYADCTNLSICHTTAWSATSITSVLNTSDFSNGTAYLWITDSDGDQDYYEITIGGEEVDTDPPYTTGWDPSKSATGVDEDTTIEVNILDSGDGVDIDEITITVESVVYDQSDPEVEITGTSANYLVVYTNDGDFAFDQVVNVSIDADDLAGTPNSMDQDTYSFTIEATPGKQQYSMHGGSISGGVSR